MSSSNSCDYYHSSSRSNRQSLPPIRSVLGDQLDLPFNRQGRQSPYDLGEIYKALPPTSGDFSNPRSTSRSMSTSASYADSHQRHDQSHSHRPNTYPPSSSHASRQPRLVTETHDYYGQDSRSPSHTTSSKSSSSKKYACTWEGCDKRFERQHALDTHMNIHLEQKPFACPVPHCGKVFNVRSNMRRHLLTHKDIQPDSHFTHDDDADDDDGSGRHYRPTAPSHAYYSSTHHA